MQGRVREGVFLGCFGFDGYVAVVEGDCDVVGVEVVVLEGFEDLLVVLLGGAPPEVLFGVGVVDGE